MSLFLLIVLTNVNVVKSEPTAQSSTLQTSTIGYIKTIATKDTLVSNGTGFRDTNYGDWDVTQCGWGNDNEQRAYFVFPFTNRPAEYINVYLDFEIHGVYEKDSPYDTAFLVKGNMNLTRGIWEEDTITWNNQPTNWFKIMWIEMWSQGSMRLNMTDLLRDAEENNINLNNFSVCLYPTDLSDAAFGQIYSKEWADSAKHPRITWEYNKPVAIGGGGGGGGGGSSGDEDEWLESIPGYDTLIMSGCILGIVTILIIIKKVKTNIRIRE